MSNRRWLAAVVGAASTIAACAGSGTKDDFARGQRSAPVPAAAPNAAPQTFDVGPVTCAGGELFVAASMYGITIHELRVRDGVHACCVGGTCIYNQCVSGCGQCAGKGCQP
jgi:hypothetical protein